MSNDKHEATYHGDGSTWENGLGRPDDGTGKYALGSPERLTPPDPALQPKKRKRVFMWFFIAVQLLFVLWLVTGIAGSGDHGQCGSLTAQECSDAASVGTGIGIMLIVGLWAVVDFILGITFLIVKMARR